MKFLRALGAGINLCGAGTMLLRIEEEISAYSMIMI